MSIISFYCLIVVFFYLSFIYGYSLYSFVFKVKTTYDYKIYVTLIFLRINELSFIYFFNKLLSDN
jgi:hypothetical protein